MPKGDAKTGDNRIKEIRERRNLKLREIAEKCGVEIATINRFERGNRQPTIIQLRKIASALGVLPAELLLESDTGLSDKEWTIIRSMQTARL